MSTKSRFFAGVFGVMVAFGAIGCGSPPGTSNESEKTASTTQALCHYDTGCTFSYLQTGWTVSSTCTMDYEDFYCPSGENPCDSFSACSVGAGSCSVDCYVAGETIYSDGSAQGVVVWDPRTGGTPQ
jgi:hypothetical protein